MKETHNNGFEDSIAQAIEEMKSEQGNNFSLDKINLAELQRRTGVSRVKLQRLKENNFEMKPHGHTGHKFLSFLTYCTILFELWLAIISNNHICPMGFDSGVSGVLILLTLTQ